MSSKIPKLVVFDLDYTLWPFWVDTHVDPPFTLQGNGKVIDGSGRHVDIFPDVPQILQKLQAEGIKMAVASRTTCTKEANQLIDLFKWNQYFAYKEIYPGSKVTHFEQFRKKSGIPFESMLFFDDEDRNIVEVGKLGVTSILVDDGLTHDVFKSGFDTFARK